MPAFELRFISHFYLTLEIGVQFTKVCLKIASGVMLQMLHEYTGTPAPPLSIWFKLQLTDSDSNHKVLSRFYFISKRTLPFAASGNPQKTPPIFAWNLRKYFGFKENQLEMVQLWVSIYQWICLRKHLYRKASVFPWNWVRFSCQFSRVDPSSSQGLAWWCKWHHNRSLDNNRRSSTADFVVPQHAALRQVRYRTCCWATGWRICWKFILDKCCCYAPHLWGSVFVFLGIKNHEIRQTISLEFTWPV